MQEASSFLTQLIKWDMQYMMKEIIREVYMQKLIKGVVAEQKFIEAGQEIYPLNGWVQAVQIL